VASHETVAVIGGGEYEVETYGGSVYRSSGVPEEAYNSFPAIATFVTSYGRVHLWGMMQIAGWGHYYYGDTDSLVVDQEGFDRLDAAGLVGSDLGQMKVESVVGEPLRGVRERFPKAKVYAPELPVYFRGAKVYDFGEEHKHKGIPADAPLVAGKRIVTQWPKVKSSLRRGTLGSFANRIVAKTEEVSYDKGLVTESGWVEPWHLSRDEHGEHVDNLPSDPASGLARNPPWLVGRMAPRPSIAPRTIAPTPVRRRPAVSPAHRSVVETPTAEAHG
jgi:hypothetical protein